MEKQYFSNDWKKIKRQPCAVYTRVMWYLRPVSQYNIWKKTEFYSRKYFDEKKTNVNDFDRFWKKEQHIITQNNKFVSTFW